MKNIFLLLLNLFIIDAAFAQDMDIIQTTRISHYVFPDFIKGTVIQKNGHKEQTMLNYNSVTQEMVFLQNGSYLALGQLENIDTVIIEGRKFTPVKEIFYEVITDTRVPLLINHKCRVIAPGKDAGYGSTSESGSIESISKILGPGTYLLKLPDNYKIIPETEFLVKKDNNYIKITTSKQVSKVFPSKADAIEEFVKKNKTNFKSREDMANLIRFCNAS